VRCSGTDVFGADAIGSSQLYTIGPHGHGLRQITHVDGGAVIPTGRRTAG
jgi:hypothetical protein